MDEGLLRLVELLNKRQGQSPQEDHQDLLANYMNATNMGIPEDEIQSILSRLPRERLQGINDYNRSRPMDRNPTAELESAGLENLLRKLVGR